MMTSEKMGKVSPLRKIASQIKSRGSNFQESGTEISAGKDKQTRGTLTTKSL